MAQIEDKLGRLIDIGEDTQAFLKEIADKMTTALKGATKKSDDPILKKLDELRNKGTNKDKDLLKAVKELPEKFRKMFKEVLKDSDLGSAETAKKRQKPVYMKSAERRTGTGKGNGIDLGRDLTKKLEMGAKAAQETYKLGKSTHCLGVRDLELRGLAGDQIKLLQAIVENTHDVASYLNSRGNKRSPTAPAKGMGGGAGGNVGGEGGLLGSADLGKGLGGLLSELPKMSEFAEKAADLPEKIAKSREQLDAQKEAVKDFANSFKFAKRSVDGVGSGLQAISYHASRIFNNAKEGSLEFYNQEKALHKQYDWMRQIDRAQLNPRALHQIANIFDEINKKIAEMDHALESGSEEAVKKLRTEIQGLTQDVSKVAAKTVVKKSLTSGLEKGARYGAEGVLGVLGAQEGKHIGHVLSDVVVTQKEIVTEAGRLSFELGSAAGRGNALAKAYEDSFKNEKLVTAGSLNLKQIEQETFKIRRKGFAGQAAAVKLAAKANIFAKTLGTEVAETTDEFLQWKMTLKLSDNEMDRMARSMTLVSSKTGLVGQSMMEVVKETRELVTELDNAALYSSGFEENIASALGQAKKAGTSKFARDLFSAIGSGIDINSIDKGMATFLSTVRTSGGTALNDIQSGRAATGAGLNEISTGMNEAFKNMARSVLGPELEKILDPIAGTIDVRRLDSLTGQQRTLLNMLSKSMTGRGFGEMAKGIAAQVESGKTVEQQMQELQKRIDVETDVMKKADLKQQLNEKMGAKSREDANNSLNVLSKISDHLDKNNLTLDDAKKALMDQTKTATPEEAISKLLVPYNQRMETLGKSDLKISESDAKAALGSKQSLLDLQKKMSENNAIADKTAKDGVTAADTQAAWEERLQNYLGKSVVGPIVSALNGLNLPPALVAALQAMTALGGLGALFDMIKGSGGALSGAAGTLLGGGGAGAGAAGGGALASAGPIAAIAAVVIGTVGGLVQSFQSGAKAAEIFGVAVDKVTASQKAAASEAGYITGFFNWLTFGLFSKYLGPTGTLTKIVAQFFSSIGAFKYLIPGVIFIDMLIGSVNILWGVLKGVWAIVSAVGRTIGKVFGLFQRYVTKVFEPLAKVFGFSAGSGGELLTILESVGHFFEWIGDVMGEMIDFVTDEIMGPLEEVLSAMADVGNELVGIFIDIFKELFTGGTDFGDMVKQLTKWLSESSKWLINNVIKPMIKMFFEPTIGFLKGVAEFLSGTAGFINGLRNGNWSKVWDSLQKIFFGIVKMIGNAFWMMIGGLWKGIAEFLVGTMSSIGEWIAKLPSMLGQALIDAMNFVKNWGEQKAKDVQAAAIGKKDEGAAGSTRGDWIRGAAGAALGGIPGAIAGIFGRSVAGAATGGLVTNQGRLERDNIPIMAHAGEVILNGNQQQVLSQALGISSQLQKALTVQTGAITAFVRDTMQLPGAGTLVQMARLGGVGGTGGAEPNDAEKQTAVNTLKSSDQLEDLVDLFRKFVNMLNNGEERTKGVAAGNTRNPRGFLQTTDYFTWPQGTYSDSPVKANTNVGRSLVG